MSNKKLIAFAIAAALSSPLAMATTVTIGAGPASAPEVLPTNAFTTDAIVAKNTSKVVTIKADADDVYLGRTTGYNIRIELLKGKFSQAMPATLVDAVGPPALNGLIGNTASATLAGGGTIGATSATYSITPVGSGVTAGDGIQFDVDQIQINNLINLTGNVDIRIKVSDPVGGNQLGSTVDATLISTKQGWVISYAAPVDATFGSKQRIDVGSGSNKKLFSPDGTVHSMSAGTSTLYSAGTITAALAAGLTDAMGLDATVATVDLTVSGDNFAPFKTGNKVFLSSATNCSAIVGTALAVATNNLSATNTAAAQTVANVGTASVCFQADTTTAIAAQSLAGSAFVKQTNFLDSPATSESTEFLNMAFNGIVKTVSSFNPSSNASVDSLLRVINTSSTSGLFTIDGTCPDGTALTKATFTLAGGNNAVQYNSAELQTGTVGVGKPALSAALGTCPTTGRLRLTVTGEVGTAEVQNFLRANTSAGFITSGHNNQD